MSTSLEEVTQQWQELTDVMEQFLQAWEGGEVPRLNEYLPDANSALRGIVLMELIKIDMEQRRARGAWQPLDWYVDQFPEMLHEGEPSCDLIYEEFHVRKRAGDNPNPQEYFTKYPRNRVSLERLFDCYQQHHTMSLAADRPPRQFEPGQTVDDFQLLAKLGKGAFASVFLARQISMQRIVALKISADKGDEPKLLAQLDHPHIVRVYDQRRLPDAKLRLLYMQFAPGGTLHEVVVRVKQTLPYERNGQLLADAVTFALDVSGYAGDSSSLVRRWGQMRWPEVVCRLGIQLAQALDFAHERGVLHRDVKPANVLLTAEGTPKLADFNISFSSQLDGATPSAYFGGSLAYMSPEQLEACNPTHARSAETLDGRADLFSLAAMLWELLLGKRPFRDGDLQMRWSDLLTELVRRRREEPPEIPLAIHDPLTLTVAGVLKEALDAEPSGRPASGELLAQSLALCLQPHSRRLLEFGGASWRSFARTWPMLCVIAVVLMPNGLAGFFNFNYNKTHIIVPHPELLAPFLQVSLVLNVVYFTAGAILAQVIIGPTAKLVARVQAGKSVVAEQAIAQRLRSLRFGSVAATLGILLWLSSGLTFPLSMQLLVPSFPADGYPHFFASMMICGLIATAYPFFGLTFLVVRVIYPTLLRPAPGTEEDQRELTRLAGRLNPYLLIAGMVPLASLLVVVLMRGDQQSQFDVLALIVAGIAGLGIAYGMYQRIHADIRALMIAVKPVEAVTGDTESLRMF